MLHINHENAQFPEESHCRKDSGLQYFRRHRIYMCNNIVCQIIFFFFLSGCLPLHIEGNKTSFHFRSGERSEIKFYVQNSGGDTRKKVIYVRHKASNTETYDTKCIVSYSKKSCNSTNNICRCLGENGGAFSLNKIFLHGDSGLWIFQVWDHADSTVHVTVLGMSSCKLPHTVESPINSTFKIVAKY